MFLRRLRMDCAIAGRFKRVPWPQKLMQQLEPARARFQHGLFAVGAASERASRLEAILVVLIHAEFGSSRGGPRFDAPSVEHPVFWIEL